jgi:hypothetical protein
MQKTFRRGIQQAAALIAKKDLEGFRSVVLQLPTHRREAHEKALLLNLWRRCVGLQMKAGLSATSAAKQQILLDRINTFTTNPTSSAVWGVFHELRRAEDASGIEVTAELSYSLLVPYLPGLVEGAIDNVLSTVFVGSRFQMFENAFLFVLRHDPEYVPNYWLFQSLVRTWRESNGATLSLPTKDWTTHNNREDLASLFEIYTHFAAQMHPSLVFDRIRNLTSDRQRELVLEYLLRVSSTPEDLADVYELYLELSSPNNTVERHFLAARIAIAERNWKNAVDNAEVVQNDPRLGPEALCLKAIGLAHLGQFERAESAMRFVRSQSHAPWWLKGRANLVSANISRLKSGNQYQSEIPPAYLRSEAGKPLVQALWVGQKLRWVEELSMLSYLRNGWRYHLYAYDDIGNIPEGVEVMDANLIVPREEVFVEKAKSGAHKGSLGAFSDYFRYALLAKKGGLYSDTDVINLRRFEPNGQNFVSTEHTDAGLIGVNGALMASTVNHPLQIAALEASQVYIENDDLEFTKIGPALLARFFATGAFDDYEFLPFYFMNPIDCSRISALLEPSRQFLKRPPIQQARNVHVYTETWRIMGMDLSNPPSNQTFIGEVFSKLRLDRKGTKSVLELLES